MKKRSKSRSDFSAFLKPLSSLLPLAVFCLLVVNVFVVYSFERDRRPKVVYYVSTNSVNSVSVVSDLSVNSLSADSLPASVDTNSVPSSIVALEADYYYFLVGDRRCVKMFDRYFVEGSTTSYGRISVIFPDRILLDNGTYIVNVRWRHSPISHAARMTPPNIKEGMY